jgi:hypothetical protein
MEKMREEPKKYGNTRHREHSHNFAIDVDKTKQSFFILMSVFAV